MWETYQLVVEVVVGVGVGVRVWRREHEQQNFYQPTGGEATLKRTQR
jgi:hypothetical protein